MKKSICVLLSFVLLFVMASCRNIAAEGGQESVSEQETDMGQKTLVVYFSATGTAEPLAGYAAEILDADIYEIVPEVPYTESDLAYYTNGRVDQEQNDPSALLIAVGLAPVPTICMSCVRTL